MALMHRHQPETTTSDDDAYVEERQTTRTSNGLNVALRAIGAIAGGVVTVIGIVALIRIDWNNGFDSAPVDVAGMLFTPAVAIATTGVGLFALAAGASADRAVKLTVGIILGCVGLGVLLAGDSRADWDLERGHGWLAVVVGAVLIVTGLLMHNSWETRRSVRSGEYRA